MSDELITIRLRLTGGSEAAAEVRGVDRAIGGLDDSTTRIGTTTDKTNTATSRFRSTLSSLGRTMAYATIPVVGALGYELVRSVNAYREAAKIGDQTNAVIKSTGGAAKVSAEEVAKLSETLSLKTGVDDEEIQAGANMLLTFKNIRDEAGKGNDIFSRSVETLNDMSSAMGRDMKSSAIQLGKALNDPIAGISALSRVGVQFDEKTQKQITTLTEQGKTLKAQKIILRELTSEFGGSAKAQHDAVDKLGVAWENLEEKLGEAVYPILKDVTQWLTKALRQAQKGKGPLVDIKEGFEDFAGAVKWTVDRIDDFLTPFRAAIRLMEKWRDLTRQLVLDPTASNDAFGAALDLGVSQGPGGAGPRTPPGAPAGNTPGPRSPKLPDLVPPQRRRQGTGKRELVIHNYMQVDGRTMARSTTKHILAAGARR